MLFQCDEYRWKIGHKIIKGRTNHIAIIVKWFLLGSVPNKHVQWYVVTQLTLIKKLQLLWLGYYNWPYCNFNNILLNCAAVLIHLFRIHRRKSSRRVSHVHHNIFSYESKAKLHDFQLYTRRSTQVTFYENIHLLQLLFFSRLPLHSYSTLSIFSKFLSHPSSMQSIYTISHLHLFLSTHLPTSLLFSFLHSVLSVAVCTKLDTGVLTSAVSFSVYVSLFSSIFFEFW